MNIEDDDVQIQYYSSDEDSDRENDDEVDDEDNGCNFKLYVVLYQFSYVLIINRLCNVYIEHILCNASYMYVCVSYTLTSSVKLIFVVDKLIILLMILYVH